MDNTATQSADFYTILAWLETNRKRLITIGVIAGAVAIIVGGYFWYQTAHETSANQALSNVMIPPPGSEAAPTPQAFLKIASEYEGTSAAARALLLAGSLQFENGKFADAQTSFENFMSHYSNNQLVNQAQIGLAASLEAQGKVKEATARYEDILRRHPSDSTTSQIRSALARLYTVQGKYDLAAQQYQELMKGGNTDTYTAEAGIQLHELVAQHPELIKPAPAPTVSTATNGSTPFTIPPVK